MKITRCFDCGADIETVFGYRYTAAEDIRCFDCTYKDIPQDERNGLLPIHHVGDWTPRMG